MKKAYSEGVNIIFYVLLGFIALLVIASIIMFWKGKSMSQISNVNNHVSIFFNQLKSPK